MGVPDGYKALAKIGISYKGEYDSTVTYENLDAVYYKGSTYLALIDSPLGVPNDDGTNWKYLAQGFGSDVSVATVDFEEASERANIETGETIKTVFGKIKKWFTDLTAAAFAQMITSYADIMANTAEGHLPDALAIKEGFTEINNNLSSYKLIGLESCYVTTVNVIASEVSNKYTTTVNLPKGTRIAVPVLVGTSWGTAIADSINVDTGVLSATLYNTTPSAHSVIAYFRILCYA